MDVAEMHWSLRPPPAHRVEDTLFLAFLNDPYERELGLKPLTSRLLAMPPDEQDRLRDWILEHVPEAKKAKSRWGEYIAKAPGDIVGEYAISDVDRTFRLWELLRPEITERGMREAYTRELRVTSAVQEMERGGLNVDVPRTTELLGVFERVERKLSRKIAKKLRCDPEKLGKAKGYFNIDSGAQLADAMLKAGKLESIVKTPSGRVSTKIDNLRKTCNDKELLDLLAFRSVTQKYLSSFIRPWIEQAELTGGRIQPKFNQVPQDGGGGARSGRLSCRDPNLQNISANVEESKNKETLEAFAKMLREDFKYEFIGLRDYLVADEDCWMICVDYDQQELRLLAHYERGVLMRAYLENPKLDIHAYIGALIKKLIGMDFPRKFIKITVFGIVYGMGIGKLAAMLDVDAKTAKNVRDGVFEAVPGIKKLIEYMKQLARNDEPLITWGGRQYRCEEPRYHDGEWISFEYKMLNYQIQPSAADVTKQGMIQVHEIPNVRLAVQVHDELVVMAPKRNYGPKVAHAMCDMKFNVPMSATPKYSRTTWARAK